MLKVSIKKATNLPIGDIKSSDPFVRVYSVVDEEVYYFGKTFFIQNTLDPDWEHFNPNSEEGWVFYIPSCLCDSLLFEIFDHDFLSTNDFLGKAEIPIRKVKFGEDIKLQVTTLNMKNSTLTVSIDRYSSVFAQESGVAGFQCVYKEGEDKVDISKYDRLIAFLEVPTANENPVLKVGTVEQALNSPTKDTLTKMNGVVANSNSFTRSYFIKKENLLNDGKMLRFYLESFNSLQLSETNYANLVIVGMQPVTKHGKTIEMKDSLYIREKQKPVIIFTKKLTEKRIPFLIGGSKKNLIIEDYKEAHLSDIAEIEEDINNINNNVEKFQECFAKINAAISNIAIGQTFFYDVKEKKRDLSKLCTLLSDNIPTEMDDKIGQTLQRMCINLSINDF